MQGYRTYIVAGLMLASGLAARYGFEFDPATIADAALVIAPAVMAIMRSVTKTAPGGKS